MKCRDEAGCRERDLVRGTAAWAIWCAPAALILLGVLWESARAALWIPSFFTMGAACLINARRCGRLHCHVTGPVFLLASLATILDTVGVLAIGWPWILLGAAFGTAIGYGLEQLRGLYVAR